MTDERSYTEREHVALLTDAVARETATLRTEKENLEATITSLTSEKAAATASASELQGRIDVLEGEVSTEKARAESAEKAFEDYKSEQERLATERAAVEARREERVTAVKSADESLPDEYFTPERAQRWAEMEETAFTALVADFTEAAGRRPKKEGVEAAAEAGRETAAFTEGREATSQVGSSAMGGFLAAAGLLPAGAVAGN